MFRKLWIPSESLLPFIFWLKVTSQVFYSGAFPYSPFPTFKAPWCNAFLKKVVVTSTADFRIEFVVTQAHVDILYYCFCHTRVGCLQTTNLSVFKIVIKNHHHPQCYCHTIMTVTSSRAWTFKAQWLLYAPSGLTWKKLNSATQLISVIFMDLRANCIYFLTQHYMSALCNRDWVCSAPCTTLVNFRF